ncbi:ATP-binding protein [Natronoglomus mannanivorans]|uniref:histidine kinase n=1 Tax=Natronoglomus mannanivorans TaxID=2979990 RepID=A0AAP2Z0M2_9EURY|nr:ATP-binding protein [Halobacteria archaeon AArc-xg1-1]
MTDLRTILYIAAAETDARDGAAALERVASTSTGGDLEFVVEGATDFETIRDRAPRVDCVVFAETPTTAAGAHLLDVVDACRGIPLVLYTDGAYGPTAARSTDGVDGYVRRNGNDEDGLTHLVDEIAWVSESPGRAQSDRKALPRAQAETAAATDLLESLPEGVFTVDRRGRLTYANEWIGDLLGIDATAVRDVPLEALEAAGTLSTGDLETLEDAVDRVVSGDDDHATTTATVTTDGTSVPLALRVGVREERDGVGTEAETETKTEAVVTVRPAADRRRSEVVTAAGTAPVASEPPVTDDEPVAVPAPAVSRASTTVDDDEAGDGAEAEDVDEEKEEEEEKEKAETQNEPQTDDQPAQNPTTREADRTTVQTLREATDGIAAARTEAQLFERALEAAEAVLDVDQCWLLIVEDGRLAPVAESADAPTSLVESQAVTLGRDVDAAAGAADDGDDRPFDGRDESSRRETGNGDEAGAGSESSVAERTLRTGDGGVFGNNQTGPRHRSLLSVPVGDVGVLQAVTDDADAFDVTARESAALLASITATVHARVRTEAVLETEHERISELFENVPNPVVHYEFDDGEPIVRDVNPPFESVFGYDRETIVGENVDDYIVPSGLTAEAETLNRKLRNGENEQVESRRRTATGVRDFVVTCVPLEAGEHAGDGFAIYSNVTDRKRRERELAAKNDRLEEFTGIVGHDLRNPLNVARGYLELANETGDEEHFAEVDAAHERMGELLDRLLALARRGDVIADTEPVAIHDSVRRAWDNVETDAAELVLERDDILEADRLRLTEVLENLIRNSVKHGCPSESESNTVTENGDGNGNGNETPPTIRIGATDDGFFVADDGVGIPPADRETIFESGYTTADDGTGYGLRIVEQIVEAHGWTISVTDSENGGARFDVRGVSVTSFESLDSDAAFLEEDVDA